MKIRARLLVLVALAFGCSSAENESTPESPGSAGTDAMPAAGGSAGGGDAGSGASAGNAGIAGGGTGNAGSAGDTGMAGAQAGTSTMFEPVGTECATDDDCRLVSDCCRCVSAPKGVTLDVCYASCTQTMCIAEGVSGSDDACVSGRCVLNRSCDRAQVTCDSAPPECEPGMIPSVVDGCYGPCVASTECRD
jgi:hypothetical protein